MEYKGFREFRVEWKIKRRKYKKRIENQKRIAREERIKAGEKRRRGQIKNWTWSRLNATFNK